MRTLILFLLLPLLAAANNSENINVSYSIQGETVIMTWSAVPEVSKFILKSGHEVDDSGQILYTELEEFQTGSRFQWTFRDEATKPRAIVYYRIIGLNENDEIITESNFSTNFLNKDHYTVNLNPNYFSSELEVEINTREAGNANISVEDLTGDFKTSVEQSLDSGYNAFYIDVKEVNTNRLVVKVDHNEKIVYRLVDLAGSTPPVFTSDE